MKPDAPCRIEKIAKTQGVLSDKYYLTSPARLSATRYTLTSLSKFVEKYRNAAAEPMVLHTSDVKVENGVIYLPLYMSGLL